MEMLKGLIFLFLFPWDNTNSCSNENLSILCLCSLLFILQRLFTQLGSVNISKSATASPSTQVVLVPTQTQPPPSCLALTFAE